jgi:hypothetical protein
MVESMDERRKAIERSLADYNAAGLNRRENIMYRGQWRNLEVIRVKPSLLLLNNNNNRLTAQLADHPLRKVVIEDPFSTEAQGVIEGLLSKTDKFQDLKNELKVLGQQNPGLISRDGLLINGNTRLVALRQLGEDGMDVAVLPGDATSEDFIDIEMSLQMTMLTHQDYTFTNELLMMRKYLDLGHSDKELAIRMGWAKNAKKKADQADRLLSIIEETRALSENPLPYQIFDNKKQHLKDLDDEYERLKREGDIESAEAMKWNRLSAMFLGVAKDQVRTIDEDFFEERIITRIDSSGSKNPLAKVKRIKANDGADAILGPAEERVDMKGFLQTLLNDESMMQDDGSITKDLPEEYSLVERTVRLAAEEIITENKLEDYKAEPAEILREIRFNLEQVFEKFPEVSRLQGFDSSKFEYELRKVQQTADNISTSLKKFNESKRS